MSFAAALLLYIFLPLWMVVRKGWPIRAGLTMLLASLIPLVPILFVEGEYPPGAGLLLLVVAPFVLLALLAIIAGILAAALRTVRRRPASMAPGS